MTHGDDIRQRGTEAIDPRSAGEPPHAGEPTMARRTVTAAGWMSALRIGDRGLAVARVAVLALFLTPADIGLFGIALLAVSVLETLSQSGFADALVQRGRVEDRHLNTAWTFQLLRGAFLAAALALAAPLVAAFFNLPEAVPLLRVMSLVFLLRGAENIGVIHFRRSLDFRREFALRFAGSAANFLLTLGGVLILRSAWVLVWAAIGAATVQSLLSYGLQPFRPRLRWHRESFRELFSFGRWLTLLSIIRYLNNQGDDIVVGKFLGAASLGLYQVAYRLSDQVMQEISMVFSQVSFPVMSSLHQQGQNVRRAYRQMLTVSLPLAVGLATAILTLALGVVRLFLGPEWAGMVPALRILALAGLLKAAGPLNAPVLKALGRADINARIAFARFLVLGGCIFPLTLAYGLAGTAVAVLISVLVSLPLLYAATWRIIGLTPLILARIVLPSVTASALFILAVTLCQGYDPFGWESTIGLMVAGTIGVVAYLVTLWIWHRIQPEFSAWTVVHTRLLTGHRLVASGLRPDSEIEGGWGP